MSFQVNDLLPQPPSHQGPNWPSEDFQGLCPTRRPSSTLLDPLMMAPQVCACLVAMQQCLASAVHTLLPSFGLSCSHASNLHSPFHGSTLGSRLPSCGTHTQPRFVVALRMAHACALPHHAPWAPTPRVSQLCLSQLCQQAQCWQYPRPG